MGEKKDRKIFEYWDVSIYWRGGPHRSLFEAGAHISAEYANGPMEAIRLCAEWRDCPDPKEWTGVEAVQHRWTPSIEHVESGDGPNVG